MHYVYILRSQSKDISYVGETKNLEKRLGEHNSKENTGWTSRHQPWVIEAYVECDNENTAKIVESYFKNDAGQEKLRNFAKANPLHPNPKQGFFDTLAEGRGFGSKANRFVVMLEKNSKFFALNASVTVSE